MRRLWIVSFILVAAFFFLLSRCGSFLVVNDLQPADVVVVLAGETNRRPQRGVQVLAGGYAPKMLLDVPASGVIYNRTLAEIAQTYIDQLPQRESISICPIFGLSTKAEAEDVRRCLQHLNAQRILVVTSDYHTRRARIIFQHEFPGTQIFITPAYDPQQFGNSWWRRRQWAKTTYDEWTKLIWWEVVDRWRK